jgi:predicted DCC family thiol-disulfide oxidoreductase YuxK
MTMMEGERMAASRSLPANGTPVKVTIPPGGPVILFDGVCKLCNGSVRFVIERDPAGTFRFVQAQSGLGTAILRDLGLSTERYESFVLIDTGRAWFKSEAGLRIVARLRRPWPLLRVCRLCPRPVRDWIYDRVAANRYAWFGRHESCLMPDPAIVARFLG